MTAPAAPKQEDLVFADGIPGFPDHRRFQLIEVVGDSVFQLLQSVDDDAMAMIVCSPWTFFPDYAPELSDEDQAMLRLETAEDAIVFCPITIESPDRIYANLLGPFVVNARTMEGRQVVLLDSEYEVRTQIPTDAA